MIGQRIPVRVGMFREALTEGQSSDRRQTSLPNGKEEEFEGEGWRQLSGFLRFLRLVGEFHSFV